MKKKWRILLIVTGVLVAGGGLLTLYRWKAWFGNLPEPAYATPAYPDRIILSVGEDAACERTIGWRCDSVLREGLAQVVMPDNDTLMLPAKGRLVHSRSGKSVFYAVELENLRPGRTYGYRVGCDTVFSPWYRFTMPDVRDSLTFITWGDIQDQTDGRTGKIFSDIRQRYPDAGFWAFAGDVIERPMDMYWHYWFGTMDSISQYIPVVAATGNHEYLKGAVKKLDSRWIYTFRNPQNGPEPYVGSTYYFRYGNLLYVVIDTDGLQLPWDYIRVQRWLRDVLAASDARWKIVMMHHPVYSVRSGRDNPFMRWTFKPLFERYGVDLVLEGHDHGYSRIITKDRGEKLRTPVYLVSNCSPKLYRIGFDKRHDRLGSNLNFYQYVTLRNDSLQVRAYTTGHRLYDDLLIVKDGSGGVVVTDRAAGWLEALELPGNYRGDDKKVRIYERKKAERIRYKSDSLR